MPYSKSDSRKTFDDRLRNLKKTCRIADVKKSNTPSDVKDLVMHAAIFETSAALEEYVKSFIEDYEYRLINCNVAIKKLSQNTRSFLLLNSTSQAVGMYVYEKNEKGAINKIDVEGECFDAIHGDMPYKASVNLKRLVYGKKYPTVENWRSLFYRFGLDGFESKVDPIIKGSSKNIMQSFNDVRTAIAHETPPSLTMLDTRDHIESVEKLIRGVDRVLYSHVCKHTGAMTWPG
ncbi:hypothetical protein KUV74_01735 [Halomonas sp. DP1Y21-3]|uniref:HEPN domain-containing protein n=1 Tax=Halomonas sp. DP1Y21-3 TaxID=2859080 RepID=UPI001C962B66|nr:HEPN domain-containing protein [Halomonas sp. DP1Y21-3]MBY6109112.1 hypothetical protein [Halomonas sp. DP1Y21-3]